MGKIVEIKITRFDGGISNDLRINSSNKFSITKHFDTFTYPKKLKPYYNTSSTIITEDKTLDITKFLYDVQRSSTTFYTYGLGKSGDKLRIYRNSGSGIWESSTNNTSGLDKSTIKENCFIYYKGYIYLFSGTTKLIRYDTSGVDAFNDNYKTLTAFTTVAQGVIHPSDDILYLFTDNKVHSLNDIAWTEDALTLPDKYKIVDVVPYGNYLAIGCTTKSASDTESIVFLWDRDSSLTTLSERVDFGDGSLLYLATLNNGLIGVVDYYVGSSTKEGRLLIKKLSGNTSVIVNEIVSDYTGAGAQQIERTKVISNNKLYFPYNVPLNGDYRRGIWVVESDGRATLDFIEEEVESATSKTYEGIFLKGTSWWIAHSDDGSINVLDVNSVYSADSYYESLIFNLDDSSITKKLIGVSVMHEPLTATGEVTLKYRKDENLDSSWTTIFTNSTDDSISQDAINISGATLPTFKEIQFQIISTGGAIITGLKLKIEIIDKQLYG